MLSSLPDDAAAFLSSTHTPDMTDHLTQEKRSWNMSRIRNRHTEPELIVRSLLHRCGFRFRINCDTLSGTPDVVMPKYRTAVFVHGCFWHRHPNCQKATTPSTNKKYWQKKFDENVARDIRIRKELKKLHWRTLVVWECDVMKKPFSVLRFIVARLDNRHYAYRLKAADRREILKVAEKRSRYYLDRKRGSV